MKNKPKLSVIVANYNSSPYITECLDSIVAQSFKDLEIIVYDDCSTDDSPKIIKEYEKKHTGKVRVIFSQVNRGVARTRHEAILQAEGEYITTLDSDDYYYDTRKLEKEMALIRRFKEEHGKDVLAFSNILKVRGDNSMIGRMGNPGNIKEGGIFADIICRSCMIPRDFVMRKDAYFEVGGYDSRFPIYEDWDLKIRLARIYEFRYTGINGTAYRRHGTGLSYWPNAQHIKWMKKIFKKNLDLVDNSAKKEIRADFKKFIQIFKKS